MTAQKTGVSPYLVTLPRPAVRKMLRVVKALQNLSETSHYQQHLVSILPRTAQQAIPYYAVMMGYDFHLSEDNQVKLIEVNTNTGGLWFACQSENPNIEQFPAKIAQKLLHSFLAEYRLFKNDSNVSPKLIAIIDEQPSTQFLYIEMQKFQQLFTNAGIKTVIIDPCELQTAADGLYYQAQKIDLIYNRHCDFYLQTTQTQAIKNAWQQQNTCITPNPRQYGLLADKQRLIDWFSHYQTLLNNSLPSSYLLQDMDKQQLWASKKQWAFKPINSYASRGVYIGDKLTKNKFNGLAEQSTLVQERIKPSITLSPEGNAFKTDFRLFVYRQHIIGITARLYQGQVTNLRTPQGGFSRVRII